MNILAMCITWNRPQLLGRSIHCFLQQTDPNARLFILDDAGQYQSQEHERWTLVSVSDRYPSMGTKRNALLKMALERYPQIEGFMLWDDDDANFPHAAASVSAALDQKCWAQPRLVLEMAENGQSLKQTWAGNRKNPAKDLAYGGCWAWRIDTFTKLGLFPDTNHSEDIKVARPCFQRFGESADSSFDGPWYCYNRENNSISGEGKSFYTLRGQQKVRPVKELSIGWNGPDIFRLPIEPDIHRRPW